MARGVEVHQNRKGLFEVRRVELLATFDSIEAANSEAVILSLSGDAELRALRELCEVAGMNCEQLPAEVREALHAVPDIEKTHGHTAELPDNSPLARYLDGLFTVLDDQATDGAD